ncbi:hypothetical protein W04_2362 [Pseudoalteromonas sp. SW0106-04]|uniref:HNH endonuclease n=1 Tax=Pseudoalteromonas sp. SW0106-04 TaxID=1702169 RepID=UPI0006B41FD3|nr:hypothetical protein [Pseudoalteromonas sp. SW0106-04]GAP75823.1 hypothetical protein W04_2362 [Pseudoalteromonas sp. SW0106-04]
MNLGPSKLSVTCHRKIINRKQNKKLIQEYLAGKLKWSDKSLAKLKKSVRQQLRVSQQGRCIFCRRVIKGERRNVNEDIEHFLDKSKSYYRRWTFSAVNLTLACRACNFVKSTKDLGDSKVQRSKGLYSGVGTFKWIHPYFDSYHDNIEIKKGWVYIVKKGSPRAHAATTMIKQCELDKIETIEKNSECIKARQLRLTILASKALSKGQLARSKKLLDQLKIEQNLNWFDY